MNMVFQQILVASALGLATAVASAQPPSTTPSPSTATKADQVQADRDYEAARLACEKERSQKARGECLRRAEDKYSRAMGFIGTPLSGGPGGNGAGSPSGNSNSAKQRS